MNNRLLPCVAVLDTNREVRRVARRRERHLWRLVLCGLIGVDVCRFGKSACGANAISIDVRYSAAPGA